MKPLDTNDSNTNELNRSMQSSASFEIDLQPRPFHRPTSGLSAFRTCYPHSILVMYGAFARRILLRTSFQKLIAAMVPSVTRQVKLCKPELLAPLPQITIQHLFQEALENMYLTQPPRSVIQSLIFAPVLKPKAGIRQHDTQDPGNCQSERTYSSGAGIGHRRIF